MVAIMGKPQTYTEKVKSIFGSSLVAYWPMDEASGVTALDASGNGRNGAYTNVTLGQPGIGDGKTSAYFDAGGDYLNIYSASFAALFPALGREGTFSIWFKANSLAVWSDGALRYISFFGKDASNQFQFWKRDAVNNELLYKMIAGGTTKQGVIDYLAPTGWTHLAITWSDSGDALLGYINGAPIQPVVTGLGTYAGDLHASYTVIGNSSTLEANNWHGWLAHAAFGNTALSATQIRQLARSNYTGFKLMIDFDDSLASAMDAYAYMQPRGLRGNINAITGLIDTAGELTHENLQTLNAAGWAILNHTSGTDNLDTLTEAQQETAIDDAIIALTGWGLSRNAYHLTLPGGVYNADTLTAMANTGIVTARRFTETAIPIDPKTADLSLLITAWWAKNTNDLASAQAAINVGVAAGQYMIVVFHGLGDGWGSGQWSLANFQGFIDWVVASGIQVVTRDEFYAAR